MRQQNYLVRKGARYHFRRRIRQFAHGHPITIALDTAEPAKARLLARRLAVKWDELDMEMDHARVRGTLTLEEQEALFRKGLKEELARATAHITAPMGNDEPHPSHHKVAAAAYRIVARVLEQATAIDRSIINMEVGQDWTDDERVLLDKVLVLMVTPTSVTSAKAKEELAAISAPLGPGTIVEARSQLLRGYAEAQRRAEFATHPSVVASANRVLSLLDDGVFDRLNQPLLALEEVRSDAPSGAQNGMDTANDTNRFFMRTATIKFSEQIDELLVKMFADNDWQDDDGRTRHMLEAFAWLTGDKVISDYEPDDAKEFARRLKNIPIKFKWGKLYQSGAMAIPFDPAQYSKPIGQLRRSDRTINSYLTKLEAAANVLAKTHWMPKSGLGKVMEFATARKKIPRNSNDPDRMPLTDNHLRVLYGLPLWQGGGGHLQRLHMVEKPVIYQDAAYWVPLLGTYAGLSREEACGLELKDIILEATVPHILIVENMTKSKDGKNPAGLKRPSRKRKIPLHSEILRLRFADYVAAIMDEGHKCLFPELYYFPVGDELKRWKRPGGRQFYARAWRGIIDATHAVLPLPVTVDGKYADFHSQRTYHYSAIASANVNEAFLARHIGHAPRSVGGENYNRRALAVGDDVELEERRLVMEQQIPTLTEHVKAPPQIKLLPLSFRSRVGSAKGRDASSRFLKG